VSQTEQEKPAGGEQNAASWPFSGGRRYADDAGRPIVAHRGASAAVWLVILAAMVAMPAYLARAVISMPVPVAPQGSKALRNELQAAREALVEAHDAERTAHIASVVAAERLTLAKAAWKRSISPPPPEKPAEVERQSLLPRPVEPPGPDPATIWPQKRTGNAIERLIESFDPPPPGPVYPPIKDPVDIAAAHAFWWGKFVDETEFLGGVEGVTCSPAGPFVGRCRVLFHRGIQAARCSTVVRGTCVFLMREQ
jgi:hypothetical protein